MDIKLRELSLNDGRDVFDMLQEIGPGENGFGNSAYGLRFDEFPAYLERQCNFAKGANLEARYVPQTTYWLMVNNRPVGVGKLRHHLNETLMQSGGHIGYTIRPSDRGKGYGKIMLGQLLNQAIAKGIAEVLLTCNEDNWPSRKVIEANNGTLESITDAKCRYWIHTSTQTNVFDEQ